MDSREVDFAVWVCTEHKRFLPCRTCTREPWRTIYPHSCDLQDIEIVRRFQNPNQVVDRG